ncbi:hypothetical protein [Tomitella gaofuii]|uniref:hypothetical protein n=1 Tax=Tomitella gaofuii TaxID=2760083 RepID=UPI0015FE6728|nr:hypothetical protein [Tomitella gaofuii]
MSAHEMCMFSPTVYALVGQVDRHELAVRRWMVDALTADMDGITVDALDTTRYESRTGRGKHSPHVGGVHVSTIAYRLDMEVDADPIVMALRSHVAA